LLDVHNMSEIAHFSFVNIDIMEVLRGTVVAEVTPA
jgi:hypothetical protein